MLLKKSENWTNSYRNAVFLKEKRTSIFNVYFTIKTYNMEPFSKQIITHINSNNYH